MATSPRIDKDQKNKPRCLISTTKLTVESVIWADWRLEVRFPLTRVTAPQSALTPATCETSLPWPSPCSPITRPRSPLLLTNARLQAGRRHRCIANKEVALKKEKVEVGAGHQPPLIHLQLQHDTTKKRTGSAGGR